MGTQLLPQKRGHSSPLQLFGQVYCGQTSGKIKMSPGTQGGLGPGSIVLDRDLAPPPKGTAPQLSAHVCCDQRAGWIKMPLGTEVGLGQGNFVLDMDPASPGKDAQQPTPLCSGTVAHLSCF